MDLEQTPAVTPTDRPPRRAALVGAAGLAVAFAAMLVGITAVPPISPDLAPGPGEPAEPGAAAIERSAVPGAVDRVAADASPARRVTGRCVAWTSGEPLSGCAVTLSVEGADAEVHAAADGRFEFVLRRDLGVSVGAGAALRLEVRRHDRVLVARTVELTAGSVGAGQRDAVVALGDVRLRRGTRVVGAVVDANGVPRDGALVQLRGRSIDRADGWQERRSGRARSGFDGAFELPAALPAGTAVVTVTNAAPLVSGVTQALRGSVHHCELVVAASRSVDQIEGVVFDAVGAPVPDAIVVARTSRAGTAGATASATSTTDDAGRFRLVRPPLADVEGAVQLEVLGRDASQHSRDEVTTRWGDRDAVVRLAAGRGPGNALRVVDAETGSPIANYRVQCVPLTGLRSAGAGAMRDVAPVAGRAGPAGGSAGDGWTWLTPVRRGPNAVIVWPDDPRWLPNLPVVFEHDVAAGPWVVALERAEPCRVRVLAGGRPVARAELTLVRPADGARLDRAHRDLLAQGGIRGAVNVELATATTDEDGLATLRWFHDEAALELRVAGAGITAHVVTGVRLGPRELTVAVERAARLEIRQPTGAPVRVVLRRSDGALAAPEPWQPAWRVEPGKAATFAAPAGEFDVHVAIPLRGDDRRDGAFHEVPVPVARVELAAGATRSLTLDLDELLRPAELVGTAFVDGEPADHVVLMAGAPDGHGRVRAQRWLDGGTDERGWYRFEGLPPGHYAIELRLLIGGRQVAVPIERGEWRWLPGGRTHRHAPIDVRTAAVDAVVRDRAGEPVRRQFVELRSASGVAILGELDGNGRLQLAGVPVGRYRARLRSLDPDAAVVPLTELVVPTPPGAALELRAR